ncbi:MAG: acyl-CoA dehydrogenase [Bacteroidetes bacterium GWF2_42_66]|nr:MAG: acyl-CoA dehydrogenase [Bacteroidetes bacterium GWA2_42_15]OFY02098.1 MAG: acyl-CoA dehydrogenase [Bacteroidetes bacterium GWE2_42_39]OFY43445.1 MAG: acyl-CoA dehydrogenase [Bacteroidetes bacterium GWF2_42_66]HBL76529.1 acyl-CoA dehydrogenase [Prolixibacteraceae bacterium]HCR92267.1 acyl-CoA dehydrogenase [Prolixibacteraceae bacterium]
MNAILTEKHYQIRQKVRRFAEEKIKPLIGEYEAREEFPVELVKEMGANGLFGMYLPQQFGGQGTDYLSYIIAVEEISRIDSSMGATLAAHNSLGIGPLYEFGNDAQKQKYLPGLCTGERLWAFGLTEENAGSDAKGVETTAESENGNYRINGHKKFITNGGSELAAGITIVAITGENGGKKEYTAVLVDREAPGFVREPMKRKLVWRAADNAMLYFNDCMVPLENQLEEKGQGLKVMLKTLDSGRLSIAAIGLGLAQGAFEMAKKYAKQRKQFGKTLAEFQSISFKLADMSLKIENARNTLYNACWLKDNGHVYGKQAAMAKLYSSEIAREVADEAMQIFGGNGLFSNPEWPIERFYRDQRLLQIGEGTSEILRMVISRSILNDE